MAEASKKTKDPCKVTLKNVRLSYPQLFTPRAFGKGEGKPAYSGTALIDIETKLGKNTIVRIEDAIEAAKEKKWPGKTVKIKAANMPCGYGEDINADAEEEKPELEGMYVVRGRNYKKPGAWDNDNDPVTESDNVLYGGCYVDMIVTFWAQDYNGTKRINCSLEAVRFREEGEPFGAGPVDPSEFDDDDDDVPARKSKSRSRDDDDEDDKPKRKSSRRDEEDEDDKPRSRRSSRDDDADEPPKRKSRSRDDDDDEPPKRKSRSRDEDDDEPPKRKSRSRDDDDDEPPARSKRSRDEDDDEPPKRKSRSRDDDDEPPARSRRSRDEDDDEPPKRRSRRDDDV